MYTSVTYDININQKSSFHFNCVAGYVSPHNSGICDPIIYYIILYYILYYIILYYIILYYIILYYIILYYIILYYIILYYIILHDLQSMGLLSSNMCFLILYLRLWKNSAHFWSNLRHFKKSAEKMCHQRKHPSW